MADRDASARPVRRTRRRVVLGVGVALLVVAALVAGVLVGRATAPGSSLVVVSGPVVEESSSADELSVSGQVSDAASAIFTPAPDLADSATTASGYRLSPLLCSRASASIPTRWTGGWIASTPVSRSRQPSC